MTSITDIREMKARIIVLGVGGAGGNAVNNMIASGLQGVEFYRRQYRRTSAHHVEGQAHHPDGRPGNPRRPWRRLAARSGARSSRGATNALSDHLTGAHMVFITAGMGGGTGTGAAPVIAKTARELGILTIGVVTKPFHYEGERRRRIAEAGIAELLQAVDTLLVIPNQNLFRVANEKTTFADAFALADRVLFRVWPALATL